MSRQVRELLAERASEGFVGRRDEKAGLLRLLETESELVVQIHGPAGVGKSTLLRAFTDEAARRGATVVPLECTLIEPTERGFLHELGSATGDELVDVGEAALRLEGLGDRVIITLDTYEVLRLLDTWLRQTLLPALGDQVRFVLAGRQPPVSTWLTSAEWSGLFRAIAIGPLSEQESLELLAQGGISDERARGINRFARGHPLALKLAAATAKDRPGLTLEEGAVQQVVQQLSQLFLADVEDEATREALEAASVVRRITRSLLTTMCPEAPSEVYERLAALPFMDSRRDGLRMHDAVHESLAASLKSADPSRYREYRRAAWRQLRSEVRQAGPTDLWRYTADMLYIIENPVAREAFFPSGSQSLAVEPARSEHGAAIQEITRAHEGPEASRFLDLWWNRHPEFFHVARDGKGATVAFYCMFDPAAVEPADLVRDPLVDAWWKHVRKDAVGKSESVLFIRRWLGVEPGEAPSAEQAACWLDIKRTYMELRPNLRRVYLTVVDLPTYAPVALELGFRPLDEAHKVLDGSTYHSAVLDLGPSSVDGWLAALVAAELGIEEGGMLDLEAHELVIDDDRIALTPLEFGVMSFLSQKEGAAVSRIDLLEKVWGYEYTGGSNVVDAVVRTLRKKLGKKANLVETVRGVGYRYHAG